MALSEHIYKFLCVKEYVEHGKLSLDDVLDRFEADAKPNRCSLDDKLPFRKCHASSLLVYERIQFHECADMHMMDDLDGASADIFDLPFLILP